MVGNDNAVEAVVNGQGDIFRGIHWKENEDVSVQGLQMLYTSFPFLLFLLYLL